mmetsp:Transcript_68780/g.163178  ORF Transcript_68780/g.163178 Transcript_68780/m.163178 type:complete len:237 (-) Transcript_68780:546-1256(-)
MSAPPSLITASRGSGWRERLAMAMHAWCTAASRPSSLSDDPAISSRTRRPPSRTRREQCSLSCVRFASATTAMRRSCGLADHASEMSGCQPCSSRRYPLASSPCTAAAATAAPDWRWCMAAPRQCSITRRARAALKRRIWFSTPGSAAPAASPPFPLPAGFSPDGRHQGCMRTSCAEGRFAGARVRSARTRFTAFRETESQWGDGNTFHDPREHCPSTTRSVAVVSSAPSDAYTAS